MGWRKRAWLAEKLSDLLPLVWTGHRCPDGVAAMAFLPENAKPRPGPEETPGRPRPRDPDRKS